jgi:uncharacterized membrane protein
VIKESNEAVEAWLKSVFGHHWIGHGILVVVVFIIALLVSMPLIKRELTDKAAKTLTIATIAIVLLSFLIIFVFLSLSPLMSDHIFASKYLFIMIKQHRPRMVALGSSLVLFYY